MKHQLTAFLAAAALLSPSALPAQDAYRNDFSDMSAPLAVTGTGTCAVSGGVLRAKDSYAVFGGNEWKDYEFSFRARAPKGAEQVQIWAGFRTFNRFDRYVVGIKGGLQDDLYLMRTGYMGLDEFLGVRADTFDLGDERLETIRLMATQMSDADEFGRPVRERRDGGDARRDLARRGQIEFAESADRAVTAHTQQTGEVVVEHFTIVDFAERLAVERDRRSELVQHRRQQTSRLRRVRRPVRHTHVAARDERGAQERRGVRQVGFDGHGARQIEDTRLHKPTSPFRHRHIAAGRVDVLHRHADVRQARQRTAGVAQQHASGNSGSREQQAGDELRGRR